MNTNKIIFTEVFHEVHSLDYIFSTLHTDYVIENGDYVFETERNGKKVAVTLQTANSFLMNNYSLPNPDYSVYEVRIDGEEVDLNDIEESDPELYEAINDLYLNCSYDQTPENYRYDLTGQDEDNYGDVIEDISYDEMREKLGLGYCVTVNQ